MTAVEEPPLPTAGPWALRPTLRLGVVGDAGLASRLARVVPTRTIGPRDDAREVCREVDAVLIELSAFELETGAWAHALRPGGFDRGGALAQLLRVARVFDRPVLGVDDRTDDHHDGWQQVLGTALDDVAALGPVVAGAPSWNPGLHWCDAALAAQPGDDGGDPVRVADHTGWAAAQRAAVVAGAVAVDVGDPWQRHLAHEVAALGVATVGLESAAAGGGLPDPTAALRVLCTRLDLTAPPAVPVLVVADTEPATTHDRVMPHDLDLEAVGASDRTVVLVRPGTTPAAADLNIAAAALDRAPDATAVRRRDGDVVAIRGRVLRTLGPIGNDLFDRAARVAGDREVAG